MAEFFGHCFQRKLSLGNYLRANAVAGQKADCLFHPLFSFFHAFSDIANQAAGLENIAHRFRQRLEA